MSRPWYYDGYKRPAYDSSTSSRDSKPSYATPAAPPAPNSVMQRQILSLPLMMLLWTAAIPFTPVAWLSGGLAGAYVFDAFIAGVALLCSLYFQWSIAGLTHPIAVALPNPLAQSDAYISNGRMHSRSGASNRASEVVFYYHPASYFTYVGIEAGLLLVAEFGRVELLRRVIVLGVIGALWAVGWTITPQSTKRWAWGHIKAFWFFIVLDLLRDVAFGGGRRRRPGSR
ncbi:hypothetical protein BDV96DRAFT_574854 [Lophiotrema nucula]|uniref:Uncharacterized protein n=1 Tax=Lophiotrema nucula TaxID=690887 RepID=A0A6A5Z9S3_9PLEO|nr:hypothetical protein BDV96DRAFT_574854 [Lophiotrema nucula]